MEQTLGDQADQEQELAVAKRTLESRLEESQRALHRLTQDHQELSDRFQEETRQKDQLRRAKGDLEEQKRALDRSLEKLQREVSQQLGNNNNLFVQRPSLTQGSVPDTSLTVNNPHTNNNPNNNSVLPQPLALTNLCLILSGIR
uniref:Uncharacterized protein n=1 Tax=Callorhinchus milii TaxID=7868 RepID=A0A4W3GYH3_CALMI